MKESETRMSIATNSNTSLTILVIPVFRIDDRTPPVVYRKTPETQRSRPSPCQFGNLSRCNIGQARGVLGLQ